MSIPARLAEPVPPALGAGLPTPPHSEHPSLAALPAQSWWPWVMCLIGVDYFSSLAYQPSITYEVAGLRGPIATVVVVLVTLFGLVPVYSYVAGHSPHGEGAIAILERRVRGWRGKSLVLLLLGFAATDFVMTKTLSLADAAEHTIHNDNPQWRDGLRLMEENIKGVVGRYADPWVVSLFNRQMMVTIVLGVVGFVFWYIIRQGFNRRVVGLAVVIVLVYLLLTAVIIGSGLLFLASNPELVGDWYDQLGPSDAKPGSGGDWLALLGLCLLAFPQLSLGLSGFEMSMVVMPQVKGEPGDDPQRPKGRIRNTRKLLVTAAGIMSVYLLGSSLVTAVLIRPQDFLIDGKQTYRALAYLAHGGQVITGPGSTASAEALCPLLGNIFGTLYDVSTVLILSLAGTSIITSLQSLVPRFLLRFGMEQRWSQKLGVLFGVFALINLAVTVGFRASVQEQRGAYATGVLASISFAGILTVLDRRRRSRIEDRRSRIEGGVTLNPRSSILDPRLEKLATWGYGLITLVFVVTTVIIILLAPVGLAISVCFIIAIFCWSVISRAFRSNEMRTLGFEFADAESEFLWNSMKCADLPALVPHRPGKRERDLKEACIRQEHQLAPELDIVFIEVEVADPSDFLQKLLIEVFREERRFVIKIKHCVSVSHAIAAVALELSKVGKPPTIHFGWSEISLLEASWSFWAFGEGNVPWKVRELIAHEEPNPERRPRIVIG
jgi:hypothetical protein